MRLAIVPYTVRADGTEILTFAFAPCCPGGRPPPDPPCSRGDAPRPPWEGLSAPYPEEA